MVAEELTLIEKNLPAKELSLVAAATRRDIDPIYSIHRWWARRPPSVIRGLLLALGLSAETTLSDYWDLYERSDSVLSDKHVLDPFVGGGTTAVEAARLGGIAHGVDIDPLAVEIVKAELTAIDRSELSTVCDTLLDWIRDQAADMYPQTFDSWIPLHYFYLSEVVCPKCNVESPLYRDLIIARDLGKNGGVVRDSRQVAFCPICFKIHEMNDGRVKNVHCCGKHHVSSGTFKRRRFTCPNCGHRSTHPQLQSGIAPRRLLAVEETRIGSHRRIRNPSEIDVAALSESRERLVRLRESLDLPLSKFKKERTDPRPVSLGIDNPSQLFTERQLIVFGTGFRWVREMSANPEIQRALRLGLSNALTTNNRFCGYARDYGRISPLFSIRGYSLPALGIELNPIHTSAGRGTLQRSFDAVSSSHKTKLRRRFWSPLNEAVQTTFVISDHRNGSTDIRCDSTPDISWSDNGDIDICLFDPPYYDFIAYDELSEFYRAWQPELIFKGKPMYPNLANPTDSVNTFASELAGSFSRMLVRLKLGHPLAFTFHSSSNYAWDAVGWAIIQAGLLVTGLSPLRNDLHMGHHTSPGNCEWDVVITCRRASECVTEELNTTIDGWLSDLDPLHVSSADRDNLTYALDMASGMYGTPVGFNSPNEGPGKK